jgi:hypothetical protein
VLFVLEHVFKAQAIILHQVSSNIETSRVGEENQRHCEREGDAINVGFPHGGSATLLQKQ